jgi:23S rRNA (guanine745-N1)-methyltransferase
VRRCGLPLEPRERTFVCPRGHAYDLARSGYVNLLQPQDRRAHRAGDAAATLDARSALLAEGLGRSALEGFAARAAALPFPDGGVVVELGAGAGDLLGLLGALREIAGIGIDLSTAAAERAARRFPDLTWVVANADRRLPLLDRSADLVLSLHARRNAPECARVLAEDGRLLVGVPAADDLIELRETVMGRALRRDRTETVVAEHRPYFDLVERSSFRERRRVEPASLGRLLAGTYRGQRTTQAERAGTLESLDVTFASEVCLFVRRTDTSA